MPYARTLSPAAEAARLKKGAKPSAVDVDHARVVEVEGGGASDIVEVEGARRGRAKELGCDPMKEEEPRSSRGLLRPRLRR